MTAPTKPDMLVWNLTRPNLHEPTEYVVSYNEWAFQIAKDFANEEYKSYVEEFGVEEAMSIFPIEVKVQDNIKNKTRFFRVCLEVGFDSNEISENETILKNRNSRT